MAPRAAISGCSKMNTTSQASAAAAPLAGVRLLKAQDVMAFTGHTDKSAFWQWAKRNSLPFIRLGGKTLRFEENAVKAWLDQRTVGQKGRAA